jgi:hypothetical protein
VKRAFRVEAHDKAGEEFANALKRAFPGISDHLTEDVTIAFHGTMKGRDVLCTFQSSVPQDASSQSKFSRHYNPDSPEVRERRTRLFDAIRNGHSPESAEALKQLTRSYSAPDSNA